MGFTFVGKSSIGTMNEDEVVEEAFRYTKLLARAGRTLASERADPRLSLSFLESTLPQGERLTLQLRAARRGPLTRSSAYRIPRQRAYWIRSRGTGCCHVGAVVRPC